MKIRRFIVFLLVFLFFSCKQRIEKISAEESKKTEQKWTFMIYMAADNDLESYALQDMNEMESAFNVNSNTTVLVLLDRIEGYDGTNDDWTGTRVYEIRNDSQGKNNTLVSRRIYASPLDMHKKSEVELDTGNPYVLESFINYAKEYYPAEHFALFMWGHGSGWRGCAVDDSSNSSMTLQEFGKAGENQKLDLLVMDTSFGLSLETMFQLKENFLFLAGTPGIHPVSGLDYEKMLSSFFESDLETDSLISSIRISSGNSFHAFKASEVNDLFSSFENFLRDLSEEITDAESRNRLKDLLFNNVKSYQSTTFPCDLYIDIKSMTDVLSENYQEVKTSVQLNEVIADREVSVHLIPLKAKGVTESTHSEGYIKTQNINKDYSEKCSFVKESNYWVPGNEGNSILDKLFYTVY